MSRLTKTGQIKRRMWIIRMRMCLESDFALYTDHLSIAQSYRGLLRMRRLATQTACAAGISTGELFQRLKNHIEAQEDMQINGVI